MKEIILMSHVVFGVGCILLAVWLFVDVLHASDVNLARIRALSRAAAICMWISFVVGGYWYVHYYPGDKALILKGPWPFSHNLIMETKEHLVIILLLLASFLPVAAANNLVQSKDGRRLMLWTTAAIALVGLVMEGEGAMIAMGVKVALLAGIR